MTFLQVGLDAIREPEAADMAVPYRTTKLTNMRRSRRIHRNQLK
jgi:hypothetical protein